CPFVAPSGRGLLRYCRQRLRFRCERAIRTDTQPGARTDRHERAGCQSWRDVLDRLEPRQRDDSQRSGSAERCDMPPRVLLADDHVIVRQGFRALLEREGLEVVAEAANGHEAVRLVGELLPDAAVPHSAMPLLTGLEPGEEERRPS